MRNRFEIKITAEDGPTGATLVSLEVRQEVANLNIRRMSEDKRRFITTLIKYQAHRRHVSTCFMERKFCERFGLGEFSELPACHYNQALRWLTDWRLAG